MRRMIFTDTKVLKHGLCFLLVWCFVCYYAVGQGKYYSWDFSDCELKDILYAVSLDSGISIIADDTVCGKGDLKFTGKDFTAAFDAFLKGNRLFVEKSEVWIVSRFRMVEEEGSFFLDAYDMQPNQILEKISCGINCALTFDVLPAQKISVHFKGLNEAELMDSLGKRFGSYEVTKNQVGYHFSKKNETRRIDSAEGYVKIERNEKGYSVDIRDCKFSDVIEKLFLADASGVNCRSFCFLASGDTKVQRSVFGGLDFTDTLGRLCAQSGYSYICDKDLFYIFADADSKNKLIAGNRKWNKYSLNFTKSQDFLPLLNKRIGKLEVISLPDEVSFLCYANDSERTGIEELIKDIDIKREIFPVYLKYIKPSELLNHLPPSVDKSSLIVADDDSVLYFRGTSSTYEILKSQIELCDVPVRRLSYDLLIVQYDECKQTNWNSSLNVSRMKSGDKNAVGMILGSVMSFNLNVVNAFGLSFAAELQNSIEENKTKVFADTTLHGVSGKKINFQNTNTYRYRDNNVDPSTGLPVYSGVTKEISSGIKLDILGWVSGDGMITSTVTASVSRQGNDTSSSTGNPPPTSEKVVTTEVCGKSGEPVVLSGLIQTADASQQKRTPILSRIPLLGWFFKSKGTTKENMQMVIYLVPHIDGESEQRIRKRFDETWAEERIESFMKKVEVEDV